MIVRHREPTITDQLEAMRDYEIQRDMDGPQEFDEPDFPLEAIKPIMDGPQEFDALDFFFETIKPVVAKLYDVKTVFPLLTFTDSGDGHAQRRIKGLAKEMIALGGERDYCLLPKSISALTTDLRGRFPNFSHVVDHLENHLILSTLNRRVYFPPLLLEGPPGVGKTFFAKTLAKLLCTSYLEVHFESAQNSSTLSGSSEFWGNSQHGELFNTLVRGQYFNPLVVVDEVDKCSGGQYPDPVSSLYQLLEQETAKDFRDEAIKRVSLDASGVMWILTANDTSRLPDPILSRVTVLRVDNPDYEQCNGIVRQIYASVLVSMNLSKEFENALSNEVADCFATHAPREMKKAITSALAMAAKDGRRSLVPEDIPSARGGRRLGFH